MATYIIPQVQVIIRTVIQTLWLEPADWYLFHSQWLTFQKFSFSHCCRMLGVLHVTALIRAWNMLLYSSNKQECIWSHSVPCLTESVWFLGDPWDALTPNHSFEFIWKWPVGQRFTAVSFFLMSAVGFTAQCCFVGCAESAVWCAGALCVLLTHLAFSCDAWVKEFSCKDAAHECASVKVRLSKKADVDCIANIPLIS